MNKIDIILILIFTIIFTICGFIFVQNAPVYKCVEYKEVQTTKRKTFYPIVPGYETYTYKKCVKEVRVR